MVLKHQEGILKTWWKLVKCIWERRWTM